MSREHSPKPGANWDTRVVSVERVVPDDPADDHDDLQPSRRERRGQQRAKKKGRR